MNAMPDTRNHAHADMLLNDYVLGTLSAADQAWMDDHIATCAICQLEIPLLLQTAFALPFAVDEPPVEMSSDLWDRIELSIRSDTGDEASFRETTIIATEGTTTADPTATWPDKSNHRPFIPLDLGQSDARGTRRRSSNVTSLSTYKWIALAAAAVLIVGLSAVLARALLWTEDNDSPPQTIAMVDAAGNPIGSNVASLHYIPADGTLVLDMADMPPAPAGQTYQAWLIAGDVPVPIGTVNPALGEFEHDVNLDEFDAFAITVEPAPDGSELPTSNPIIVAPLETVT